MGSFRSKGRNHGLNRRRSKASAERQSFPRLESLEERRLLSGGSDTLTPIWKPTSTDLFDAQNGPMANLGVGIVSIYKAYVQDGNSTALLASQFPQDNFQNGMVGLQLKMLDGGDFSSYLSQIAEAGMHVTASSENYNLVEGFAPPDALPTIAELAQTQSGTVNTKPAVYAANYQGAAYNEAETSMFADVARGQFNVNGTGVTVGVLSDSVSQYAGGLSDSYNTGDLNSNNPVNVLSDGPSGSTDEGRGMLENIHDVAPGASLAFATAYSDELTFGNNIKALASQAGANIIADDVSYSDEPFFQDGIMAQAINTVTAQGVTYFGSAGNQANDGYLSTFRAASGSIANIGSGTFMNFDPSGGTNLELPITTDGANAQLTFEYDQPFQTQEPAGSPGRVTSTVYFWVLDSSGNVVVGANAQNNNVAIQEPIQIVNIPNAGSYKVVIQVVSGANPGHVEFINFNENVNVTIDQTYGVGRGDVLPHFVRAPHRREHDRSRGHPLVGAGALPGPDAAGQRAVQLVRPGDPRLQPRRHGPVNPDNGAGANADGARRRQHLVLPARRDHRHLQRPVPGRAGRPRRTCRRTCRASSATSSAAPNAAAVAALMKQLVPERHPRPDQIEHDHGGVAAPDERPVTGVVERPEWLRLPQRHRRPQRRRPAPGLHHDAGQRRDDHDGPQRDPGDLQQAGRFQDGHGGRPDVPLQADQRTGPGRHADRR